MVYPALCSGKGGVIYCGPQTIIYDVIGMRRYSRNILQWRKIKTKNMNCTQWRLLSTSKHVLCISFAGQNLVYPILLHSGALFFSEDL